MSKPMPAWAMDSAIRAIHESNGVTKREASALTWALHLENVLNGAACGTGRSLRRETMRALLARGFVREQWAVVCDGDGFSLEPERERLCYALTDAGRALAQKIKAEEDALMRRQFTATEAPTP